MRKNIVTMMKHCGIGGCRFKTRSLPRLNKHRRQKHPSWHPQRKDTTSKHHKEVGHDIARAVGYAYCPHCGGKL